MFEFEGIRLVPTNKFVDKIFYSNIDHRFNMVSIIAASNTNNFVADNVEMNRDEISYTYKTIKILKKAPKRGYVFNYGP